MSILVCALAIGGTILFLWIGIMLILKSDDKLRNARREVIVQGEQIDEMNKQLDETIETLEEMNPALEKSMELVRKFNKSAFK